MDRNLYRGFLALSVLMGAALIVTPAWDWWHYRPLRASGGAPVALGALLPAPFVEESPAQAAHGSGALAASAAPSPAPAATALPPRPVAPVPPSPSGATGTAGATGEPRRAPRHEASSAALASSSPRARVGAGDPARRSSPALPGGPSDSSTPHDGPASGSPAPWAAVLWGAAASPDTGRPAPSASNPMPTPTPAPVDDARPAPEADEDGPVPRLGLTPNATSLTAGQILHLTVTLSGAHDVSGVPFHLAFNPEVLEFQGARLGPVFTSTSLQPLLMASVSPNRPGDLVVGLALVKSSGLLDHGGGLLVLDFQAKEAGRSDLSFDRTSVRGAFSQDLPVELHGVSVEVH